MRITAFNFTEDEKEFIMKLLSINNLNKLSSSN